MSLNSWFKHYNNAHEGESIANAWANGDAEVVAFHWTLLELISKFEEREIVPGYARISPKTLQRITCKNERGLLTLLTKVITYFGGSLLVTWTKLDPNPHHNLMRNLILTEYRVPKDFDPMFVHIFSVNWLELQERRGGKREAKLDQNNPKTATEERSKKKEERREKLDTDIVTSASATRLPVEKSLGSKIWDSYSQAFQNRYQVIPVRNAKTNSQCSQLASRLGEDAHAVIAFYLTHNDQWFLKRQHDLGSLLQQAESLHSQWQRGQAVTSAQVRTFEKQSGNMDLLEKVRKGEV